MSSQQISPSISPVKNVFVFFLALSVFSAAVAYYFYVDYAQEDNTYQVAGLVGGICLGLIIAYQSTYGRQLWNFLRESRVELRKIVWPSRHSSLVNSGLVFVLVFFAGIYFWGLDTFFRWAVWALLGFE